MLHTPGLLSETAPNEVVQAWLQEATTSGIPELAGFAEGVRRDLSAVQAALTLSWSQGQTEGQINRLMLLKCTMYGRAKFDLLRQRVLYHAAA
jgi:transposase